MCLLTFIPEGVTPDMSHFAVAARNNPDGFGFAILSRYNSWGESDDLIGHSFMKYAKGEAINDNRYCAINLRRRQTIELRFFRPSLRKETVQAAFQMCDAAHRYTAGVSTQDVMKNNALAFGAFREWIASNPFDNRYLVLDARINERVL